MKMLLINLPVTITRTKAMKTNRSNFIVILLFRFLLQTHSTHSWANLNGFSLCSSVNPKCVSKCHRFYINKMRKRRLKKDIQQQQLQRKKEKYTTDNRRLQQMQKQLLHAALHTCMAGVNGYIILEMCFKYSYEWVSQIKIIIVLISATTNYIRGNP